MLKSAKKTHADRPKRIPMNGAVDILVVGNKDPDHEYRWVSDNKKGRIQRFEQAWWDKVSHKEVQVALGAELHSNGDDSPVTSRVGTLKDGDPEIAYLMRIPKEYYNEDQEVKQDRIDSVERQQLTRDESYEKGQYGENKIGATRSS